MFSVQFITLKTIGWYMKNAKTYLYVTMKIDGKVNQKVQVHMYI